MKTFYGFFDHQSTSFESTTGLNIENSTSRDDFQIAGLFGFTICFFILIIIILLIVAKKPSKKKIMRYADCCSICIIS